MLSKLVYEHTDQIAPCRFCRWDYCSVSSPVESDICFVLCNNCGASGPVVHGYKPKGSIETNEKVIIQAIEGWNPK
jgi:hypothetical protein